MAIYNEILTARFSRMLQKLLSMKGGQAAKQLAGEVAPMIPFFNGVENRYLESWNRFGFALSFVASAGNFNSIQLRNPGTTFPSATQGNVIAVIEKVLYSNNNATAADGSNLSHGASGVDLTTIQTLPLARFDPRQGATVAPFLIVSSRQAVAQYLLGQLKAICELPANGNFDYILFEDQEIPILPGDAIALTNSVANSNGIWSIWWRERVLEESERF